MKPGSEISGFYSLLSEEEKSILCEALAEDFFFLEETLQERLLALLHEAEPEIANRIKKINSFTMR